MVVVLAVVVLVVVLAAVVGFWRFTAMSDEFSDHGNTVVFGSYLDVAKQLATCCVCWDIPT